MLLLEQTCQMDEREKQDRIQKILQRENLSYRAAEVLVSRGIDTPEAAAEFLHSNDLHDPFLLNDMQKACQLIRSAIEHKERIAVYTDYDCDGVCSCAILMGCLTQMGADAIRHIPNRHTEGYGLNHAALDNLKDQGVKLLITADCGITNIQEVAHAKELGLQVILTDHHQPLPELPQADCVINPKLSEGYPFSDLCGAGVAFKLCCALAGEHTVSEFIDITALATVADIVPLIGENRVLVKRGLKKIRTGTRLGVEQLCREAGIVQKEISSGNIAFGLAPRLNAAGRMGDADRAYTLLMTVDSEQAKSLAQELEQENRNRQELEQKIVSEAIEMIQSEGIGRASCVFVASQGWHPGVAGIAASRLVEIYKRPAFVGCINEDGTCVGSARSIEGIDIFEALCACGHLLSKYGGHRQAGGFSLLERDVEDFRLCMMRHLEDHYPPDTYVVHTKYDIRASAQEVDLRLAMDFAHFEPFGFGNASPVILLEDVEGIKVKQMGKQKEHFRCAFKQEEGMVDAVMFRAQPHQLPKEGMRYDIVTNVGINTYREKTNVQCVISQIQPNPNALDELLSEDIFCDAMLDNFVEFGTELESGEQENDEMIQTARRISESAFGTLISVQTPQCAKEFLELAKKRHIRHLFDIYLGTLPQERSGKNVLLAAPYGTVDCKNFEDVVLLDGACSGQFQNIKNLILGKTEEFYLFANALSCDRMSYEAVYRGIVRIQQKRYRNKPELLFALQRESGVSSLKANVCLNVFLELGFFQYDTSDGVMLTANRARKKRPLEDSARYRSILTMVQKAGEWDG